MKKKLHINYIIFRCGSLIALMLISLNAKAQIVYTDIVPDFSGENLWDGYHLNLNNDFIVDYIITSAWYFGDYVEFAATNNFNSSISFVDLSSASPVPLNSGVLIDQTPNTTNGETYEPWGQFAVGYCHGGQTECFYDWENLQDKYLGLRFLINGFTHYGWARMDVISNRKWIIKDYAYNTIPNAPIVAGQMVLGLEELDFNKVKVLVVNQAISVINLTDRTTFNLYTINGQRILQGELQQNRDSIDVQNLTSGLYIFELIDHNSGTTIKRKILIP